MVYESLGPVLAIMPWNLPFWQVLRFFIPAALVGNTVVVKHAETVQGCALALEALVRDAGGPEGLYVNVSVQRDAVPAMISDSRIRAVTVTGSVAAGRAVAQQAGHHGKKVVLELGGSDPFVVLEDADIGKAVQLGVTSRYSNNAQSCIAAKRFLIAEPVADAFIKAFVEQASTLKVGDPLLPATRLGPQARADLLATTERQVADAVAAGGRVLTGGKPLEGPGYFYAPTVLVDVPHDAAVAREEFFGPVALMFTFKTEEDAIRLANDTEFGLGAAVWSKNAAAGQCRRGAYRGGCRLYQRLCPLGPAGAFWRSKRLRRWPGTRCAGRKGTNQCQAHLGNRLNNFRIECQRSKLGRQLPDSQYDRYSGPVPLFGLSVHPDFLRSP